MLKAILCLALLGDVAFGAYMRPNPELNEHWESFKTTYAKKYEKHIEPIRRMIWEENVRMIQKHNLEADMGKHTYTLGMNSFGDQTIKEIIEAKNGLRMAPMKRANASIFLPPLNMDPLPDTVDWRTKGYVTPVKDQGECGSCWAFSTTGSLEGQYFRKAGTLKSFSEQQLVDCSGHFGDHGCNGGFMDYAFDYVLKYGIEAEQSYPYEAKERRCEYKKEYVVAKDRGHIDVMRGSEGDLQKAVATVGPISVAIDAGHSSFHFYKSGVYNEPLCSTSRLDHGVLAVGYGTENGVPYWLVKNSWGVSWGAQGYIKMSRNRGNQCGIATMASYPLM